MVRIITTQIFIERSKNVHGENEFKYDKAIYTKMKENIELFHVRCGKYIFITPDSHLRGVVCSICSGTKKSTTEIFIKRSDIIHNNAFEYKNTIYVNNWTPVLVYHKDCKREFYILPSNHLKGRKCFYCYGTPLKDLATFINQSNEIHNFEYDYKDAVYINANEKLKVWHKICGKNFMVTPSNHYTRRCPHCYGTSLKTTNQFILDSILVHGNGEYNYDSVIYVNAFTKVKILHIKCNKYFTVAPNTHLAGIRCSNCFWNKLLTQDEFVQKATRVHKNQYSYECAIYKDSKTFVKIYCKKCEQYFEQRAGGHLNGCGCPFHYFKTEKKLYDWLINQGFDVRREEKFPNLFKKLSRFDFYIENLDILIELDGKQHFVPVKKWKSDPKINQEKDKEKIQFSYEYGLTMIRIYQEDVASTTYDWQSILLPLIKKHKKPTVYLLARDKNLYDSYRPFVNDLLAGKIEMKY